MQLKGIIAGILLLILYAIASIPKVDIGKIAYWEISIPNPLYVVCNATLLNILDFKLTLNWIFLGLAILCILIGIFSKNHGSGGSQK